MILSGDHGALVPEMQRRTVPEASSDYDSEEPHKLPREIWGRAPAKIEFFLEIRALKLSIEKLK